MSRHKFDKLTCAGEDLADGEKALAPVMASATTITPLENIIIVVVIIAVVAVVVVVVVCVRFIISIKQVRVVVVMNESV